MINTRDFRELVKDIEHDNKRKDILAIFAEKNTRRINDEKNTL